MSDAFIKDLHLRLSSGNLPGREIQYEMAPVARESYHNVPLDHKLASVMALIYPKNERLHTVFIQRTSIDPRDVHAGQISLPGGKFDASDKSMEACALRELNEEIGVVRGDVEVLGKLSSLYVFVSGFLVYPFVGYIKYTPEFNIQVSEVENVIEIPLQQLSDPKIKKKKDLQTSRLLIKNTPYFDLDGNTLWGATAMIINEMVYILRSHNNL